MKSSSFSEFFQDGIEDQVIDMNNPNCSNCNECCSMGVLITEEEFKKLKRFLFNDKRGRVIYQAALNRIKKFAKPGTVFWMCPFSGSSKRCSIYNLRPQICKDFHCSESLGKNIDKDEYAKDHKMIYDLFKDKYDLKKGIQE